MSYHIIARRDFEGVDKTFSLFLVITLCLGADECGKNWRRVTSSSEKPGSRFTVVQTATAHEPADVACGRNDQRARADCERWYADAYAIPSGVGERLRGGERARATRRGCERPFVGGRRGFGSSGFGRRDALIRWREHGASCAAGRFPDAFVGGLGDGGLGCRRRGRPLAVFRAAADGCREVGENWG